MEKQPYCRIDFTNCALDYDYTICHWHEVSDQIQTVEFDFVDADEKHIADNGKPEIKVTPVFMTEDEFNKERESWIED